MIRLAMIAGLVLMAGCAAQKSPEEMAEDNARRAAFRAKVEAIKISEAEPQGCRFITAAEVGGEELNLTRSQDRALFNIRAAAVRAGANTVFIDRINRLFDIEGRLFDCP